MVNVCIIPARGGSKGIPHKNIKLLNDRPLIYYSICAAQQSKKFDCITVSSDSQKICDLAQSYGAQTRRRPACLAVDWVHSVHVVLDCIKFYGLKGTDLICMLLPTAPLRVGRDIIGAVESFNPNRYDSLVSVCEFNGVMSSFRFVEKDILIPVVSTNNFENQRQDSKTIYEVNGSIYISTVKNLIDNKSFHKGKVQPFIMERERSIDINDKYDWKIAEALI